MDYLQTLITKRQRASAKRTHMGAVINKMILNILNCIIIIRMMKAN